MPLSKGNTAKVLEALQAGPKSSVELVRATGLTKAQVREVIRVAPAIRSRPVLYEVDPTLLGLSKKVAARLTEKNTLEPRR